MPINPEGLEAEAHGEFDQEVPSERLQDVEIGTGLLATEQVVGVTPLDVTTDVHDMSASELNAGAQPETPPVAEKSSKQPKKPSQHGTRRGHPMKQVKQHLAEQGKLNAKPAMSPEQRRARRKKRKR